MRAGIRTVIIPEKNKKDLAEFPRHLKRRIKFVPVKHMSEVLDRAILAPNAKARLKRSRNKRK